MSELQNTPSECSYNQITILEIFEQEFKGTFTRPGYLHGLCLLTRLEGCLMSLLCILIDIAGQGLSNLTFPDID